MKQTVVFVLFLFIIQASSREIVTVFAAASMTDVLQKIAAEMDSSEIDVRFNFASSSTLARQIESGAEADVFISADLKWMNYLTQNSMADTESVRIIAGNSLVMICPKTCIDTIEITPENRKFPEKIAVGDTEHVPAGIYARQALEKLGWWRLVENRLIPAADVRTALKYVEIGEADGGIVYSTDAAVSEKVRISGVFPDSLHDKIVYPAASVKGASRAGKKFLDFLKSEQAIKIFISAGFVVPAEN